MFRLTVTLLSFSFPDDCAGTETIASYLLDFLRGTLAPARRASERPIAIACFRLFTVLPDRPLFNCPLLRSCIALLTFCCAFLPYLAMAIPFHFFLVEPRMPPCLDSNLGYFFSQQGQCQSEFKSSGFPVLTLEVNRPVSVARHGSSGLPTLGRSITKGTNALWLEITAEWMGRGGSALSHAGLRQARELRRLYV